MTCDRCYRDADVLVPYTRDLNSNRVLMRCCASCEREVIEQAGSSVVPDAPVGTPVVAAPPDCRYCGGTGYWIGGDELHVCWCRREEST